MPRQCPPPSNALLHSPAAGVSSRAAAPHDIPIDPVLVALDNWGPEFQRLVAPVAASVGMPLPSFGFTAGVLPPHAAADEQYPLRGRGQRASSGPPEASSGRVSSSRTSLRASDNRVYDKPGPSTHRALPTIEDLYAQALPRPVIWRIPVLPPYTGNSGQGILPPHSQPPTSLQDYSDDLDFLYTHDDFTHSSADSVDDRPPSVPLADSAAANIPLSPNTQVVGPEYENVREAILMFIPPSPQKCPFAECDVLVGRESGAMHVRSAHKDMFSKKKTYVRCPVPECGVRVGPANYAKHYLSHLEKHPCPNGCGGFLSRISQYEMKRHERQCAKNLQERECHQGAASNQAPQDPTAAWTHSFPLQTWHTHMRMLNPSGHSTHVFSFALPLAQGAAQPRERAQFNFNLPTPPSDAAPSTPPGRDRLVVRTPSARTARPRRNATTAQSKTVTTAQTKTVSPTQEFTLRRSTRAACPSSAAPERTGKRRVADHVQLEASAMKKRRVEED